MIKNSSTAGVEDSCFKSRSLGAVQYITKSFGKTDPVADIFASRAIDQIVMSKRRNKSVLTGEWGQQYFTTQPTFRSVELQREMGPSYERSATQRNMTGVVINPQFGGVGAVAAAGKELELIVLQQHMTVQMDEIHGKSRFTGNVGITMNPSVRQYVSATELIAEKIAMMLDTLEEDRMFQAAVCLLRGYVPSIMDPTHIIADYRDLDNCQVGVYEIPKSTKRDIGTVPILLTIRDILFQAAQRYGDNVKFMLVCNDAFLHNLLEDKTLLTYYANQPMASEINPLYTGQFISHWASRVGNNIDIIRDSTMYYKPAKTSAGKIESQAHRGIPHMATSGTTLETNPWKQGKPSARMIAVIPNQFIMVKGVLHDNEGGSTFQRIKAQPTDFNTGVTVAVEQMYLPYYACPHLAMEITIASGDDVTGVGKLKTAPTRYQSKT